MPSEINRFSGHYPIREFARITGVNPVTLRAWERRYGIVQPQRTEKGHRFYSEADIQRVNNILYWLEQGYPVRQVKL
ncbi:MAG: MerR family transcriptional regulator, partial [Pseudomonadota bacterium]